MASSSCCSSLSLDDCSSISTCESYTPIYSSQWDVVVSPLNSPCNSESDAPSLPWLWVIQAVASCSEIHVSTLKELIDVVPVVRDDFCEKTRELLALRCLEDLFDSAYRNHVDAEASASLDTGVGFDFSRSCEDVLHQILHKTPLSDLKVAGAELLKWDIFPFILHKRATVKCDLEQLKESISEGTHPYTYYLRESSGLTHPNGGYPVHINDNECSDLSERDNRSCTYCENMEEKDNSVSVILENGNKSSSKESLLDNILPSKRNEVESANEHVMGYQHEKQVDINECDDTVNACGEEISSDSDGYHNETIDLAARKHEFLSSNCTFGQSAGSKEKSLCMKCNGVGELLACKTTTCQIMAHKSCLSAFTQIDAEGNFLCPFCAYSQAISEYREAKKEASLARKELAMFFCKDIGHRNTFPS